MDTASSPSPRMIVTAHMTRARPPDTRGMKLKTNCPQAWSRKWAGSGWPDQRIRSPGWSNPSRVGWGRGASARIGVTTKQAPERSQRQDEQDPEGEHRGLGEQLSHQGEPGIRSRPPERAGELAVSEACEHEGDDQRVRARSPSSLVAAGPAGLDHQEGRQQAEHASDQDLHRRVQASPPFPRRLPWNRLAADSRGTEPSGSRLAATHARGSAIRPKRRSRPNRTAA